MNLFSISIPLILFLLAVDATAQERRKTTPRDSNASATVEVLAFDTRGKFLGAPIIKLFESYDHKNLSSRFRGSVAQAVPFGEYQIEGYLPAYSSDKRWVRIYQQRVTVILGLTVGYERPSAPLTIRGHVTGQVSPEKKTYVRLIGVYSDVSLESAIGIDGGFDLAGLTWGAYLLLVISEDGIVASRTINVPYTGVPLEIEIKRDHSAAVRFPPTTSTRPPASITPKTATTSAASDCS